jgi:hypothetical protein
MPGIPSPVPVHGLNNLVERNILAVEVSFAKCVTDFSANRSSTERSAVVNEDRRIAGDYMVSVAGVGLCGSYSAVLRPSES